MVRPVCPISEMAMVISGGHCRNNRNDFSKFAQELGFLVRPRALVRRDLVVFLVAMVSMVALSQWKCEAIDPMAMGIPVGEKEMVKNNRNCCLKAEEHVDDVGKETCL